MLHDAYTVKNPAAGAHSSAWQGTSATSDGRTANERFDQSIADMKAIGEFGKPSFVESRAAKPA